MIFASQAFPRHFWFPSLLNLEQNALMSSRLSDEQAWTSSGESNIRASILNVCIQLGALDDNNPVADWIFNDPTDEPVEYERGRTLNTKIKFHESFEALDTEPDQTTPKATQTEFNTSISSRIAARFGFRSKSKSRTREKPPFSPRSGPSFENEPLPTPRQKSSSRSLFNRRSRSMGDAQRTPKPASTEPDPPADSRNKRPRPTPLHLIGGNHRVSEDWTEVLPPTPGNLDDNVFLGRTPRKLRAPRSTPREKEKGRAAGAILEPPSSSHPTTPVPSSAGTSVRETQSARAAPHAHTPIADSMRAQNSMPSMRADSLGLSLHKAGKGGKASQPSSFRSPPTGFATPTHAKPVSSPNMRKVTPQSAPTTPIATPKQKVSTTPFPKMRGDY